MLRRLFGPRTSRRKPEGEAGIRTLGHRRYVGGRWEELGRLQFDFLRARGLRPEHLFLDVACGALRAGVHLVPWLEPGHYHGIEKEAELVRLGLEEELDRTVRVQRAPRILVDGEFRFERFGVRFDQALANSLFTHLPGAMIHGCLASLRPVMVDGGVFHASFFEVRRPRRNPATPHDHGDFHYTRGELEALGAATGWRSEYVGPWGHPRGQHMMAFHADPGAVSVP